MAEVLVGNDKANTASTLDGQWIRILEARHYGNNVEFTPSDLDAIVRNYAQRKEDAPFGIGRNSRLAKPFGSIQGLKRMGNYLIAQLDRVSPQLEEFFPQLGGKFRLAVAIHSSPTGPYLQRVGLLRDNGSAVREKDLPGSEVVTDAYGNDEVVFMEHGWDAAADVNEIAFAERLNPWLRTVNRIKQEGKWRPEFDRYGFPQIFRALYRGSERVEFSEDGVTKEVPGTYLFAKFIEAILPIVDSPRAQDQRLHNRAQEMQRLQSISYSEALDRAVVEQKEAVQEIRFAEDVQKQIPGAELDREARKIMRERTLSYSDALDEVVRDRPELAREDIPGMHKLFRAYAERAAQDSGLAASS